MWAWGNPDMYICHPEAMSPFAGLMPNRAARRMVMADLRIEAYTPEVQDRMSDLLRRANGNYVTALRLAVVELMSNELNELSSDNSEKRPE